MADLRIFSYLPNPRIWKATIAARRCGVDVEVRGTRPSDLKDWLWDFDTRPFFAEDRSANAASARISDAFTIYLAGIEQTLKPDRSHPVSNTLPLADICFVPELCLFSNERRHSTALQERSLPPALLDGWDETFPRAFSDRARLAAAFGAALLDSTCGS